MKLKRHQSVLLVVVVVLVAFLAGVMTGVLAFLVAPVSGADTDGENFDHHSWRGRGTFSNAQVLDSPVYVSGFRAEGFSETIVASPMAVRFEFSGVHPPEGVVRWWFKSAAGPYPKENTVEPTDLRQENGVPVGTPGSGWVLLREHTQDFSNVFDSVNFGASIAVVRGNFIGIVRAEFILHLNDGIFGDRGWNLMTYDEAGVVPGWGVVSIENSDSLVQVGEDLVLRYDVGAACSVKQDGASRQGGCGWSLTVRNRETGATPEGWTDRTPGDFSAATVRTGVRASWFQLGAHNEYEVKLFNQLTAQEVKMFVTIDDKDLAPGTPKVDVSPGPPYRQNDEITLTVHADPNAITDRTIVSYHVVVRQGGRVLVDERSSTGILVLTVADEQMDLRIEATAFDGERTGGVRRVTLAVLDADLDNDPPPSNAPEENPGLVLLLAGAILIVTAFAIPTPKSLAILRYLMVLVGFVLGGAAFYVGIHLPLIGRVGL